MGFWLSNRNLSDQQDLPSKGTAGPTFDSNSSHEEEYEEIVPLTINSTAQKLVADSEGTEITMSLPRKLDKYGFILNIDSKGDVYDAQPGDDLGSKPPTSEDIKLRERREMKWNATMDNWERRRPHKLKQRLRKGIPDKLRGSVWAYMGGGVRKPGLYQDIVQSTSDAMLVNFRELASKSSHTGSLDPMSADASSPPNRRRLQHREDSSELIPYDEREDQRGRYTSRKQSDYAFSDAFRSVQDTIERDIHRTFPRHNLFYEEENDKTDEDWVSAARSLLGGSLCDPDLASIVLNLESDIKFTASGGASRPLPDEAPGGQAALRRVLRAYSYYDREIGYCQGMNFIAGMFLTIMSEEEAFWLLVAAMHENPCQMRGMFGEGMRETHKVLHVAECLVHHHLPKLAKHFDRENVHVTMYATQWLLTQYTSSFKFDLVTRVWDCFLGEGWKIIYRVMLALLQQWQSQLLQMSFEEILSFFRDLPDRVDGNSVIETALRIKLKTRHILKYEKEWYAQQQTSSR